MTGNERKLAFRNAAAARDETLAVAALLGCGVTWDHLSRGISDDYDTPLSADVKQKFAAYIGTTVEDAFGSSAGAAA